jgi:hypothetical protein
MTTLRKRRTVEAKCGRVRASAYIHSFKELAERWPGMKVVLYARVSHRTQDHKGNLNRQVNYLLRKVKKRGAVVIGVHKEIVSGKIHDDSPKFRAACKKARKHGAIVVARSVDRFLRNARYYDSKENWDAQPWEFEFDMLMRMAGGAILATVLHPNTPPDKVKRFESKWGQAAGQTHNEGLVNQGLMKNAPKIAWLNRLSSSNAVRMLFIDIPMSVPCF